MQGPTIDDGAVAIDGQRIVAVGKTRDLLRQHPRAELFDYGDAAITPGLINAHTHLELSALARPPRPERFVDWLLQLIGGQIAAGERIQQVAADAAGAGAAESLGYGVTCVGDITRFASATRLVLADSPLRVVSFGEIQAMAGRRHLLEARLAEATDGACDAWEGPARLMTAVSPHAPYSVEPSAILACLEWARAHDRPITTHLAESPAEAEFLAEHGGEFRELWGRLGGWSDDVPKFAGGPIRLAQQLGLLERRALLAHVNYVDDAELAILAGGSASVVWCPRTHAYFGHPPHRFQEMIARGIRVCLGTDSRASAPDLNVLEEGRLLRRTYPRLGAQMIWKMITSSAAEALQIAPWAGTLFPGKWADLAIWPLAKATDPLEEVLQSGALPIATWVGGAEARAR
jgi:cytosine/adenosine deaminase-related metal-dependent hydrolase